MVALLVLTSRSARSRAGGCALQRHLRLVDRDLLVGIVHAEEHVAFLDLAARREIDRADDARHLGEERDRLVGDERADGAHLGAARISHHRRGHHEGRTA